MTPEDSALLDFISSQLVGHGYLASEAKFRELIDRLLQQQEAQALDHAHLVKDSMEQARQYLAMRERVAALEAQQEAQAREQGWRPIETDTNNGECVLVWWPSIDAYYPIIAWQKHRVWRSSEVPRYDTGPTHWMPLPAAPRGGRPAQDA